MVCNDFKILLVDNDVMSLKSLASFLRSEGYNVDSFDNPNDAFECFVEFQHEFVLSDHSMPEMTGLQLIEQIRKLNPHVCTILYTGYASQLLDQQEPFKHVDHFFRKPLRIRKLINILNKPIKQNTKEER